MSHRRGARSAQYLACRLSICVLYLARNAGIQIQKKARTLSLKTEHGQIIAQDVAWVDEQLAVLAVLLPDIVAKLGRMKADLVLALASDTQASFPGLQRYCYASVFARD